MALFAARQSGRPVKWTSERTEGFLSDFHARDNVADAALALDKDGKFLGFRLRNLVNIGAYFSPIGAGPATNNLGTLSGVYTTPQPTWRLSAFSPTVTRRRLIAGQADQKPPSL